MAWIDNMREKVKRDKLARELTHTQSYGQTDPVYQRGLEGMRSQFPDPRIQEQGLQGGMELGSVGGIPVSLTDLIPADFGANALATLGKAGIAKLAGGAALVGGMKSVGGKSLAEMIGKKTEFELAHEVARRNAALPIEQGGLGLPVNNTAMDRAKAMGAIPTYHGTAQDLSVIDPRLYGSATGAKSAKSAFWSVDDPSTASGYAKHAAEDVQVKKLLDEADKAEKLGNWDAYDDFVRQAEELEMSISRGEAGGGQNIMPLMLLPKKQAVFDAAGNEFVDLEGGVNKFISQSKLKGADLATIQNLADDVYFNSRPATHYAALKPNIVRSRFAAFDPMQRNSANILAGGAGGAIGLSSLLNYQDEYQ